MDAHKSTTSTRKSTGFLKAIRVKGVSKNSRSFRKEGDITIKDPACVAKLNGMLSEGEFEHILDSLGTRDWDKEEFLVTFEVKNKVGNALDSIALTTHLTNPDPMNYQGMWSNRVEGKGPKATPDMPTSFDFTPTGFGTSKTFGDMLIIGHHFGNFEVVYWEGDKLMDAKVTNAEIGSKTSVEIQRLFTALILYDAGHASEDEVATALKAVVKNPTPIKVGFRCHNIDDGQVGIILDPSREQMANLEEFFEAKPAGQHEFALGSTIDWEAQFCHDYARVGEYLGMHAPHIPSSSAEIAKLAGIDFRTPSARTVLGKDEDTFDFTILGPEALGAKIISKYNEMNAMADTPAEVQKAMRILKAWNQFQRVLKNENGATSETFTMDGAQDTVTTKEEGAKIATPDANDLVDDEYGETMAPSARDETGVPVADEDMTVDSADASTEVVVKSARRLLRSLMFKAEEADPEMTEEEKDEAEDAIIEDLSDDKKTEEVAKCMKSVDARLALKLRKHAKLLRAYARKAEEMGAEALPETVVDVEDGDDMPESAVKATGVDKVDVSADLEDDEAPLVKDVDEKENPAIPLPKDDADAEPEFVGKPEATDIEKAMRRMASVSKTDSMDITAMIAAKRGMNQREEAAGSHRELGFGFNGAEYNGTTVASNHNGYRTVRMGDGKVMFPPMKH